MSYRSGLITGVLGTLLVCGAAAGGWWLFVAKPAEAAKSSPPPVPATVPKPFKEDQAATLTITADAEARANFRFGEVQRKPTRRVREYAGEVMIPPGRAVIVAAPLAGTLKPVDATAGAILAVPAAIAVMLPSTHKPTPVSGMAVRKGEPVFQLQPLLDPV